MGKNKQERKVGHDRFMQKVTADKRAAEEAHKALEKIDIRAVTQFILAANPDEARDRSMLKIPVLKNIELGRFDPSKNQKQQILRAATEMGWQPR